MGGSGSDMTANMKRDEAILRLLSSDPHLNLAEVGREYGISRERVRQILLAAGVKTTVRKVYRACRVCGGTLEPERQGMGTLNCARHNKWRHGKELLRQLAFECEACGTAFMRNAFAVHTSRGGTSSRTSQTARFCSRACRNADRASYFRTYWMQEHGEVIGKYEQPCAGCYKTFIRRGRGDMQRFHSRECYHRYLAHKRSWT